MLGRSGELTGKALLHSDTWRLIRRRAVAAGIKTEIGCRTFRATGITADLKNGGRLEVAQQMAAHKSAWTAGIYGRRNDEVSLDEVKRIGILIPTPAKSGFRRMAASGPSSLNASTHAIETYDWRRHPIEGSTNA
jgi:hypothetical protein